MAHFSAVLLLLCLWTANAHLTFPLSHNQPAAAGVLYVSEDLVKVDYLIGKYTRAASSQVQIGGQSVIVTVDITVGAARNPFRVLLDTGSSLLAIPTAGCSCDSNAPNAAYSGATAVSCSSSGCRSCCTSDVCPTSQCGFTVSYADSSSINGSLYTDVIQLGDLSTTVTFGGITRQSQDFVAPLADGILGFSRDGSISCSPTCVTPLFDSFVKAGLVTDAFAISLDYSGSGVLSLGGNSPSYTGTLVYTPMIGTFGYYQVTFNQLKVAGTTVASNFGQTILDTGTTLIILPSAEHSSFVSYLQTNYCNLVGACGTQTIFNGYCIRSQESVLQYPNLQFTFDGAEVSVPPSAYFLATTNAQGTFYCLGVTGWNRDFTILGYTFMRGTYIYYDRQNSTIGFGDGTPAASNPGSSSASLVAVPVFGYLVSLLLAALL